MKYNRLKLGFLLFLMPIFQICVTQLDYIKDTHRENTPSNKTRALTKSMNRYVWVIGTINQLFIRCSYNTQIFKENKVVSGKSPFFVKGPFCTPY